MGGLSTWFVIVPSRPGFGFREPLDPVQVGESGQIKEFREEKAYGEIGEYAHRHVSHLVSLYPGCAINAETPEWIEAAKTTLDLRGDRSTGWGMAHRMLL